MSAGILAQLSQRARETHSDGFTILHSGEALSDHTFERTDAPVSIMSVTKMVIGVASSMTTSSPPSILLSRISSPSGGKAGSGTSPFA